MTADIDVLIPARRGSVGLPGKNTRMLIDRPLALHSIACAQMITGVRRILVSTDDPELASQARRSGAYVPELRPEYLASATTPMADVIRYAMKLLDEAEGGSSEFLLLLDPTSPLRDPAAIDAAAQRLCDNPASDGVISVSVPAFNPLWVGVELGPDAVIRRHPATPHVFTRRQDVPGYWRINGSFYLWRSGFARTLQGDWLDHGSFLGMETPEILSHSIDTLEDFRLVEALLASGVVALPWMGDGHDD